MTATPVVTVTAQNASVFLGTSQTLDVTFANAADPAAASATGFAPFVVLDLDAPGVAGAEADGVSFTSATYLGASVPAVVGVYDANGHFTVPGTNDGTGHAVVVSGTPGDQAVYLQLPFGSFAAGQTPADIKVNVAVAADAATGSALPVSAVGGFAYGTSATGSAPTIVSGSSTTTLTPTVLTVTKTYLGPEQETATGPSYPEQWKVTGDVAAGKTVTNLTLSDPLPDGTQVLKVTVASSAGTFVYDVDQATGALTAETSGGPAITTDPATATGNWVTYDLATNTAKTNFASISGTGTTVHEATGPSLTTTFYVKQDYTAAPEAPVLGAAEASQAPLTNVGAGQATYTSPSHGTQVASAVSDPNVVTAKPIAIQKGVSSADAIVQPGDRLSYTLDAQVSNYDDLANIVVTDTLGDGQHYDPTAPLVITAVSDGKIVYSGALDPADVTAVRDPVTGTTTLTFDVSSALKAQGDTLGDLDGGAAAGDAVKAPAPATFHIGYGAVVDASYLATGAAYKPAVDSRVEQGDKISNGVSVSATMIDPTQAAPSTVVDTSGTTVSIPTQTTTKSIYEVNGHAYIGQIIQAGDIVTYEITDTLPISRADAVSLTDFLPQPVMSSTGGFSYEATLTPGTAPGVGQYSYAAGDTLHTSLDGHMPAVSVNTAQNSVTFSYGTVDNAPSYAPQTIDLLYTTKVGDAPFVDGLLLTNEVTSSETNSTGVVSQTSAIAQFTLGQPVLKVEKAVVSTTGANRFSGSEGPVAFTAPGTGGVAFSGTIDATNLLSTPLADILYGAKGGDVERFAVTVQNVGSGPNGAFGVTLHDVLPAGITAAMVSNIEVTNGAGKVLGYSTLGGGLFDPAGGIVLTDPSATQGALAAANATSGADIAVITYDVAVPPGIAMPYDKLTNTAVVTHYVAELGGANDATGPEPGTLSASSTVYTTAPVDTKTVTATSESATAADKTSLKIGETVTYSITTSLSEGTLNNFSLVDALPTGSGGELKFLSGAITSVGASIVDTNHIAVGDTLTPNGAATTGSIALGDVTVLPGGTGASDTITYTVQAVYLGSDAKNTGGQTLVNTAETTATNPNSPTTLVTTGAGTATVVSAEPDLQLLKQVRDVTTGYGFTQTLTARAGDTVQYDVKLVNVNNGHSQSAYTVDLKDVLSGLSPFETVDLSSIAVTGGAAVVNNGTLEITSDSIAVGGTIDVTFNAAVTATDQFNASQVNTATYTANTLPSGDPNFTATGYDRVETGTSSAVVSIANPDATKALTATSDANVSNLRLAPGETGTYTITVTVPEGTSPDLLISDVLPTGLSYAGNAHVISVSPGITSGTPSITTTSGGANFDFGAVQAGPGSGTITLALDATAAVNAKLASGQTLTNTVNTTTGGTLVNTNTAAAVVALPNLTLTKTESQPAGAHPYAGQEVDYSVKVGHAGNDDGASYNVVLKDILPSDETLIAGSIHTTFGTAVQNGQEIDITLPSLLGAQTVNLTYSTVLKDSVTPGERVTNTATLDYQTQPTGGQSQAEKTASATLPIVLTPTISKTTLSGNDPFLALPNAKVGETVTYQLDATIQPGTQNLVIDDQLPTGLTFVSGSVVSVGAGITGASLNPVATIANGDVVFNFGTVTDAGSGVNAGPSHVIVDVTTVVSAGAIGAQTDTGSVTTQGPQGAGKASASAADTTTIVPPAPGALVGTVFTDNNDDGVLDGADRGLGGVSVALIGPNGLPTGAVATTAADGTYSFANLPPANYSVQVTAPTGTAGKDGFSPQQATTGATTSIVNTTGATAGVAVTEGTTTPFQNAGVYVPVSLSGDVFDDVNYDGLQDNGETRLSGVSVQLEDGAGNKIGAPVTTDVNGKYSFTGLKPGTYEVAVTAPAAEPVFSPQQGAAATTASIVDPATGTTAAVTLTSGQSAVNQNAGVSAVASLTGHVFVDHNGDGVQATTDQNLGGISVQLLDGSGNPIAEATTTTASDGSYLFKNLAPGPYSVQIGKPAGDAYSPVASGNAALDSIVNTTGQTPRVTLTPGENLLNQNAGVIPPQPALSITKTTPFTTGEAGDIVTYTLTVAENADTVTAANILVSDLMPTGETLVAGSEHASVGTVTEANGGFTLGVASLAFGQAPITVTYQAKLADSVFNGQTIANTANLSYASEPSGGIGYTGSASAMVHAAIVDSLSKTLVTTSQNGGDLVIPGETVQFDIKATLGTGTQHLVLTDTLPAGLTAVSATVVSEGNVTGAAIATGTTVTPVGTTLLLDFGTITNPGTSRSAPGDQIDVLVTAKVSPTSAVSTLVTNTATLNATTPAGAIQQVTNASAPVDVVQPGAISSFVFLDAQCDGTYRIGDPGVSGVTVRLLDLNGQPTGLTTTTDSTGHYAFAGLIPGSYEVQVLAPAGTSFSESEHASGNALVDNDVNVTTGISDLLVVAGGGTNQSANAGLEFNGHFAGTTPVVLGVGQGYDGNGGSAVIVGAGGNLVHTGSGGNNIVILDDQAPGNLVEAGGGSGTDIVTSCGPLNAQTQNASNGFLFAGGTGMSTLQGGQGNTYLQGGRGNDLITAGSGVNVLSGGGSTGVAQSVGQKVTGFSQGDELRSGGISTTVLYQKGDGVETIDNGLRAQDKLEIAGYTTGTFEKVNGQDALYLGGNDLIIMNGGNGFGPANVTFLGTATAPAQETVVFGTDGLPSIVASAGAVVTAAPLPAVAPVAEAPAAVIPAVVTPAIAIPTVSAPSSPVRPVMSAPDVNTTSALPVPTVIPTAAPAVTPASPQAITMSGWNQTLALGAGDHVISGSQGNSTVTVGAGSNDITMKGWGNVITTGAGSNRITAGDGNETVHLASGSDVVTLSGWSNLITSNGGTAVVTGGAGNIYEVDKAGSAGGIDVTDFGTDHNDVLDLSKLLSSAGWDHQSGSLARFLHVQANGQDTQLGFDMTGTGGSFSRIATLQGAAAASVADLQNHGALRVG